MTACFQQMFRRIANCVCSHASGCNSNSTSTENRPFISCYLSVGHRCVSEANCANSSVLVLNDCTGAASSSGDDTCNAINESEVIQHGNMSANVSSSNKTEILSLRCSITVPNHFVTACVTDNDDDDDDNDHDDAHSLTKATNIVSSAPYRDVERQTGTDGDRIVSSFFIRSQTVLMMLQTTLIVMPATTTMVMMSGMRKQLVQYNTIQYETYSAPYVTKMLFVGARMTRD